MDSMTVCYFSNSQHCAYRISDKVDKVACPSSACCKYCDLPATFCRLSIGYFDKSLLLLLSRDSTCSEIAHHLTEEDLVVLASRIE